MSEYGRTCSKRAREMEATGNWLIVFAHSPIHINHINHGCTNETTAYGPNESLGIVIIMVNVLPLPCIDMARASAAHSTQHLDM